MVLFLSVQAQPVLARGNQAGPYPTSVFATGFNAPRGLKFGPDHYLYVAEGGTGGDNQTTAQQCEQVPAPIGPYSGGMTASISKVSPDGTRTVVVDGLPSDQTSAATGGLVSGVADVALVGNHLYGLLAAGGCSHGVPDVPNGIIKVNKDGTWSMLANLSQFQMNHPVINSEPDDFEPDGTWYSMVFKGGAFYAIEPNHGELDKVTLKGKISRVVDISASQGHIVPTSIFAFHNNFYVGNLTTFPIVQGAAVIMKIQKSGQIKVVAHGLTNIEGVLLDKHRRIYVLESTVGHDNPTPDSGEIVRVDANGNVETIATGLSLPTAMTWGPDGNIYVSNKGFGYPPGAGEIVKVDLNLPGHSYNAK